MKVNQCMVVCELQREETIQAMHNSMPVHIMHSQTSRPSAGAMEVRRASAKTAQDRSGREPEHSRARAGKHWKGQAPIAHELSERRAPSAERRAPAAVFDSDSGAPDVNMTRMRLSY